MIKLLYFARLKESLDRGREDLALPAEVATLGELRQWLRRRGGAWELEFAEGRAVRAAVNQDMAVNDTPVKDGDEIAFFPPVTGG